MNRPGCEPFSDLTRTKASYSEGRGKTYMQDIGGDHETK